MPKTVWHMVWSRVRSVPVFCQQGTDFKIFVPYFLLLNNLKFPCRHGTVLNIFSRHGTDFKNFFPGTGFNFFGGTVRILPVPEGQALVWFKSLFKFQNVLKLLWLFYVFNSMMRVFVGTGQNKEVGLLLFIAKEMNIITHTISALSSVSMRHKLQQSSKTYLWKYMPKLLHKNDTPTLVH